MGAGLLVALVLLAGCGGPEDAAAVDGTAARAEGLAAAGPGVLAPGATRAVRHLKGPVRAMPYNVVRDKYGDTVAALTFEGTVDVGTGPVGSGEPGQEGVALVKYAPDGSVRWVRTFQIQGTRFVDRYMSAPRVAVDRNGFILIAGFLSMPVDFGTGDLPWGPYLARFDRNGNVLWARHFANHGGNVFFDPRLVTDATGHVILSGVYQGTLNFGRGYVRSTREGRKPGFSGFVARYTSKGRLETLTVDGQADFPASQGWIYWRMDVAPEPGGDLYIARSFWSPMVSRLQPVLERRGPDGTLRWSRTLASMDAFTSLAVGGVAVAGDSVVLAGRCTGRFRFAGVVQVSTERDDASEFTGCVLAYGPDGEERWARPRLGTNASSLTAEALGDVFVAGYAAPGEDLGLGTTQAPVNASFQEGLYVARLGAGGGDIRWGRVFPNVPVTPGRYSGAGVLGMTTTKAGDVMLSGWFSGRVDFGAGVLDSDNGRQDWDPNGFLLQLAP